MLRTERITRPAAVAARDRHVQRAHPGHGRALVHAHDRDPRQGRARRVPRRGARASRSTCGSSPAASASRRGRIERGVPDATERPPCTTSSSRSRRPLADALRGAAEGDARRSPTSRSRSTTPPTRRASSCRPRPSLELGEDLAGVTRRAVRPRAPRPLRRGRRRRDRRTSRASSRGATTRMEAHARRRSTGGYVGARRRSGGSASPPSTSRPTSPRPLRFGDEVHIARRRSSASARARARSASSSTHPAGRRQVATVRHVVAAHGPRPPCEPRPLPDDVRAVLERHCARRRATRSEPRWLPGRLGLRRAAPGRTRMRSTPLRAQLAHVARSSPARRRKSTMQPYCAGVSPA